MPHVPGWFGITKRITNPTADINDCWQVRTWRPDGYAEYARDGLVHRIAWIAHHKRTIPAGHEIHHTCETRNCVNPRHLQLLTSTEHHAIHRPPTDTSHPPSGECRHGHPWTSHGRVNTQGRWICVSCAQDAARRYETKRHRCSHE